MKFRITFYLFIFSCQRKFLNKTIRYSWYHFKEKGLWYINDYKFMEIQPIRKSLTFHSGVTYFSNEKIKFGVCRLAEIMKSVGSAR